MKEVLLVKYLKNMQIRIMFMMLLVSKF